MNPAKINQQYPDRATFILAKYSVLEGNFHDIIGKIGSGGMFITSNRRIAVGQPIVTDFSLLKFKNTIQVPGRVVRKDTNGFSVTFSEPVFGLIKKEGHFPEIFEQGS